MKQWKIKLDRKRSLASSWLRIRILESNTIRFQICLPDCVTSGRVLDLSKTQFPHLLFRDDNSTWQFSNSYLELLWGLHEMSHLSAKWTISHMENNLKMVSVVSYISNKLWGPLKCVILWVGKTKSGQKAVPSVLEQASHAWRHALWYPTKCCSSLGLSFRVCKWKWWKGKIVKVLTCTQPWKSTVWSVSPTDMALGCDLNPGSPIVLVAQGRGVPLA